MSDKKWIKVRYEISIGFPGARRKREIEIESNDLEGLNAAEQESFIDEVVWEDAMQYAEVSWEIVDETEGADES